MPAVEETHIFAIIAPLSLEMKCVSTVYGGGTLCCPREFSRPGRLCQELPLSVTLVLKVISHFYKNVYKSKTYNWYAKKQTKSLNKNTPPSCSVTFNITPYSLSSDFLLNSLNSPNVLPSSLKIAVRSSPFSKHKGQFQLPVRLDQGV